MSCPAMLVRTSNANGLSMWSVMLPSGWAKPFWERLALTGIAHYSSSFYVSEFYFLSLHLDGCAIRQSHGLMTSVQGIAIAWMLSPISFRSMLCKLNWCAVIDFTLRLMCAATDCIVTWWGLQSYLHYLWTRQCGLKYHFCCLTPVFPAATISTKWVTDWNPESLNSLSKLRLGPSFGWELLSCQQITQCLRLSDSSFQPGLIRSTTCRVQSFNDSNTVQVLHLLVSGNGVGQPCTITRLTFRMTF